MRYRTNWLTVVLFCLTAVTIVCLTPTGTYASGGQATSASSARTAAPQVARIACGPNVDAPCQCPLGADNVGCNCYQAGTTCVGGPPIYGGGANSVSRSGSLAGGASVFLTPSTHGSSQGPIQLNHLGQMPDAFAAVAMAFVHIFFGL
jgi:hypothetical protein